MELGSNQISNAITTGLAAYARTARFADLPEAARREGARSIVNILGCTIGGARHPGVDIVDDALRGMTGEGAASLSGRGRRTDALHAPLIDCLASSIDSFDDTHEQAMLHPSSPVFSAARHWRKPGRCPARCC